MTFKVGDRIKMNSSCNTGPHEGEVLTVRANIRGELYVQSVDRFACTCQERWSLVPPTDVISKESLVAGETVIVDKAGREMLVLEVGKTSFLRSSCNKHESALGWCTFTEAIAGGWKIKLPPEQETPETITFEGKKYDKKAFEERLKELKPIE